MAYVVPCVRFSDVVQSLMSEICVPAFTGSLKSLASLLQRRGFLYSTVTPPTDLSGLLHHCNTRYEWLVRPCSTGTFALQETPSFAWRTVYPLQSADHPPTQRPQPCPMTNPLSQHKTKSNKRRVQTTIQSSGRIKIWKKTYLFSKKSNR